MGMWHGSGIVLCYTDRTKNKELRRKRPEGQFAPQMNVPPSAFPLRPLQSPSVYEKNGYKGTREKNEQEKNKQNNNEGKK